METPRIVAVTPSQRAVIGQLTHDGAPDQVIAHRLNLSTHTVKSHVKHVLTRVGVHNRTALVVELLRGRVKLHTLNQAGHHMRERAAG